MPKLSSKIEHLNGAESEYMINWELVDLVNGSNGALTATGSGGGTAVVDADIMPIVDGSAGIANQKTITVGNLKDYIQDAVNDLSEMGGVTLQNTVNAGELLVHNGTDYINAVIADGDVTMTVDASNNAYKYEINTGAVGISEMAGISKASILIGDATNAMKELTAGSNGYVLTLDDEATDGIKWGAVATALDSLGGIVISNAAEKDILSYDASADGGSGAWVDRTLQTAGIANNGANTNITSLGAVTSILRGAAGTVNLFTDTGGNQVTIGGGETGDGVTIDGTLTVNQGLTSVNSADLAVNDASIAMATSGSGNSTDWGGGTSTGTNSALLFAGVNTTTPDVNKGIKLICDTAGFQYDTGSNRAILKPTYMNDATYDSSNNATAGVTAGMQLSNLVFDEAAGDDIYDGGDGVPTSGTMVMDGTELYIYA